MLVDDPYAPQQRYTADDLGQMAAAAQPPELTARSFLLFDEESQQVIFRQEETLPLPPASLTKLMTALLVFEQASLTDTVTIVAEDVVGGTSSTMGLRPGEVVTVEDLLWGLLVPSGNDAALALARHVSGSVDAFVQRMNERATELGLRQSRFANPHGLDADGQVSSAADLLAITQRLLGYPLFATIVATPRTTVAGHALRNTNELLGTLEGAVGVKTGTTSQAGQCLIARVERNGQKVLIVLLGSQDRYGEVAQLLDAFSSAYSYTPADPNALSMLNRMQMPDGRTLYLSAVGSPPSELTYRGNLFPFRAFRRLSPPPESDTWTSGAVAGVMEWWFGDRFAGTQQLIVR